MYKSVDLEWMWSFLKAIPVIQAREVAGTKGIFFETFP